VGGCTHDTRAWYRERERESGRERGRERENDDMQVFALTRCGVRTEVIAGPLKRFCGSLRMVMLKIELRITQPKLNLVMVVRDSSFPSLVTSKNIKNPVTLYARNCLCIYVEKNTVDVFMRDPQYPYFGEVVEVPMIIKTCVHVIDHTNIALGCILESYGRRILCPCQ